MKCKECLGCCHIGKNMETLMSGNIKGLWRHKCFIGHVLVAQINKCRQLPAKLTGLERSEVIKQSLETGNTKSGDHDLSIASDESSFYDIPNSKLKSSKSCLKIAHINCCGLLGKLNEIKLLVGNSDIDVLGLTETHLKPQIKNEEISINGFCILTDDRLQRWRGLCSILP